MGFIKNAWEDITGVTAGKASERAGETAATGATRAAEIQAASVEKAIAEQRASAEAGQGFLQPFQQLGESGLAQSGFLTDSQAQFDFLQDNPLFQSALEGANTQTQNIAAARGRLSSGDTLQRLSENVLLSASPLIAQQKQSINNLLGYGTGIAGAQANIATGTGANIADLITSGGAAEAGGVVGAANARAQGTIGAANARQQGIGNLLSLGTLGASFARPPPTNTFNFGGRT